MSSVLVWISKSFKITCIEFNRLVRDKFEYFCCHYHWFEYMCVTKCVGFLEECKRNDGTFIRLFVIKLKQSIFTFMYGFAKCNFIILFISNSYYLIFIFQSINNASKKCLFHSRNIHNLYSKPRRWKREIERPKTIETKSQPLWELWNSENGIFFFYKFTQSLMRITSLFTIRWISSFATLRLKFIFLHGRFWF